MPDTVLFMLVFFPYSTPFQGRNHNYSNITGKKMSGKFE